MGRRSTLLITALLSFAGCPREQRDTGVSAPAAGAATAEAGRLTLASPALKEGQPIDKRFTCDGADASPALSWTSAPRGTASFALVVDDPDAPSGVFTHWLLWGVPAARSSLPEKVERTGEVKEIGRQGKNDFDELGWRGPCPPAGKPHRYRFTLHALSVGPELAAGASKAELERAMAGKVLGQSTLTATYQRSK
jgi:Raf kinase inhibitor-like YbhB/YbcL family protein